jgi:4a-hydroxytetrahydrobiopterin dehydratase
MLSSKKCVPCEGGIDKLAPEQVNLLLGDVPGWNLVKSGEAIERTFTFDDFATALEFTNKIGAIAEAEGHHPDLKLGWGYVECQLWTHAIGGLHDNDFIIASKINAL